MAKKPLDSVEVRLTRSIPMADMKETDFINQFRAKGNAKFERLANVNFDLFNGMKQVIDGEEKRGAEKGGTTIDYGTCVYTTDAVDNLLGWKSGSDHIDRSMIDVPEGQMASTPTATPGTARIVTRNKDNYVRQIFDVDLIAQEQLADFRANNPGNNDRTYDSRISLTFLETSADNGVGAISANNVRENLGKLSAMKCMLSDGTDKVTEVGAKAYEDAANFIANAYKGYVEEYASKGSDTHKSLKDLGLTAIETDGSISLIGGGLPDKEKTGTAYNNEVRAFGEGFTSYLKEARDKAAEKGEISSEAQTVLYKIGVEMHPTQINGHTVIQPQLALSDRPFTNVVNNLYNYRNHRENLPVLSYDPNGQDPTQPYMTLRGENGTFTYQVYTNETERQIKDGTYKGADFVTNMTPKAIEKMDAAADKAMQIFENAGVNVDLGKLTKEAKAERAQERNAARETFFEAVDSKYKLEDMSKVQAAIEKAGKSKSSVDILKGKNAQVAAKAGKGKDDVQKEG